MGEVWQAAQVFVMVCVVAHLALEVVRTYPRKGGGTDARKGRPGAHRGAGVGLSGPDEGSAALDQ